MAIYLDHAATTPLRREALDAMLPFLTEQFGNPSSAHAFGRKARAADQRDYAGRCLPETAARDKDSLVNPRNRLPASATSRSTVSRIPEGR